MKRLVLLAVILSSEAVSHGTSMIPQEVLAEGREALIVLSRKEMPARTLLASQAETLRFVGSSAILVFRKAPEGLPNAGHPFAPGDLLLGRELRLGTRGDVFHVTRDNVLCTYVVKRIFDDSVLLGYEWEERDPVVPITLIDRGEITLRSEHVRDLPNKSLQPTATAVTPPAAQEIMPAVAVAEH
jgi:hypothetical protein